MTSRRSTALANAIVWAAVLPGSAWILRGTEAGGHLIPVLAGGAAASIVVVAGGKACRRRAR